MKKIQHIIIALMTMVGLVALPVVPAFAQSATDQISQGVNQVGGSSNSTDLTASIKTIVNVLLFILGAIAVIMIIIGGIRYTTSNGDASATKSAKDTILYAVIGLIVAILAYAIVKFVTDSFK